MFMKVFFPEILSDNFLDMYSDSTIGIVLLHNIHHHPLINSNEFSILIIKICSFRICQKKFNEINILKRNIPESVTTKYCILSLFIPTIP